MTRARFLAYDRVSTDQQATEGISLEAQRAKLAAYAEALDLDLVAIHEDAGLSAKSLDRPGLRAALADLDAAKAVGILVVKLDRLTRSVADLGHLLDRYFSRRFELVSVTDSIDTRTAAGRLVLNVLTSVGQWEREATGERTSEALRHLRAQGVRIGRTPLGLTRTTERDQAGRLYVVPDPEGQATATRIRELRAAGLTLRAIAAKLIEEDRPTRRGGVWAAQTVAVALRSAT